MLAEKLSGSVGNASNPAYIEDVFSTYLYTGTGSTLPINNGIDLAGKGGMVWFKSRNQAYGHGVVDTARGTSNTLQTNNTNAQYPFDVLSSYNSNGFTFAPDTSSYLFANQNGTTYASWTFRKQPKFFDVVTYTGDGNAGRTVSHNLGATPACIIVKRTDGATNWRVYHRSLGATQYLDLDETNAAASATTIWNDTAPTSTVFSVGTNSGVNASGGSYVAYLFASNAGGFGLTGTDNVISCGSYTEGASDLAVTLGYEPSWILVKPASTAGNWNIYDTMRGASLGGNTAILRPNTTDSEVNAGTYWYPTATGFVAKSGNFGSGVNMIYIAIRRGPMKVPTSGTSVFAPVVYSGTGTSGVKVTTTFPVDLAIVGNRTSTETYNQNFTDRLRGPLSMISSPTTSAQLTTADWVQSFAFMNGFNLYNDASVSASGTNNHIAYSLKRAPSFFDVVCYTGVGGAGVNWSHNLGVAPEFMIVKRRSAADDWAVYHSALTASNVLQLNSTIASTAYSGYWNNTAPTSSVFTTGAVSNVNGSGSTYVAYLFATCAGVSKVGNYTGTGALQTVNCGFTGGARYVLIKRTDSTGSWYVWDSARGITSGNDPYLLLNSTAAEVTSTNYVDTDSTGFQVTAAAPAGLNASGGTYIFLAIA